LYAPKQRNLLVQLPYVYNLIDKGFELYYGHEAPSSLEGLNCGSFSRFPRVRMRSGVVFLDGARVASLEVRDLLGFCFAIGRFGWKIVWLFSSQNSVEFNNFFIDW